MKIADKFLNKSLVKEVAGVSYLDLPSVLRYVKVVSKVINRKI